MENDQPNNPLHGIRLIDILEHLVSKLGWEKMGQHVAIRCFQVDPSIKSSLAFLRKNQWARDKVESLYLENITPPSKQVVKPPTKSHSKYSTRN